MAKSDVSISTKRANSFMSKKQARIKSHVTGFLFITPLLLMVVAFIYYGIFYNATTSLFEWNGISKTKLFVGLENYAELFKDATFYLSLKNTFVFMFFTVLIQSGLGLVLAYLLHTPGKGRIFMRGIFFFPVVLSPVVLGAAFQQIYDFQFGYLNEFFRFIGLELFVLDWLGNGSIALYSIIAINIYQWMGASLVMYFTAMLAIPKEVFEAAKLDGAGFWRTLFSIVFPNVKGITFTLTILGAIGALKTFDIVWISTKGGPGTSTEFISTYLFRKSLLHSEVGYASAIAMILLTIALIITVIQVKIQNKTE